MAVIASALKYLGKGDFDSHRHSDVEKKDTSSPAQQQVPATFYAPATTFYYPQPSSVAASPAHNQAYTGSPMTMPQPQLGVQNSNSLVASQVEVSPNPLLMKAAGFDAGN